MPLAAALLLMLSAVAASPAVAAEEALTAAHALLSAWHEDPARIDQARAQLEAAVTTDPTPETLTELSRVWFLTGDFRARTEAERVTAYERGMETGRRAVALAPRNDRAHLWLAINTGRTAEIRGVMRALALVSTIREESDTVLKLNPSNVEGLVLAGGLAADLPAMMGGDKAKAEGFFKRALEIDPRLTGGRIELARLYISAKRWPDAQRELQSIVDETAATDLPRWTVRDRPRARAMLTELRDRGRIPAAPAPAPGPSQSP
jgi:tetratricopeptide (TPR) repeat protein